MSSGMHHLHKRKRIYQKLEKYPHPDPLKRAIDKLGYATGLMVPAVTIVQVYKVWQEKNADGISLIAYAGYLIGNMVWIVYGTLHKEPPLVLMHGLLLLFNAAIFIGALIF